MTMIWYATSTGIGDFGQQRGARADWLTVAAHNLRFARRLFVRQLGVRHDPFWHSRHCVKRLVRLPCSMTFALVTDCVRSFFRITSTADAGGTVINYSDRFNITGLTGTTPDLYRHAAEALDGSTVGPATADNVVGLNVTSTSSETAASSTTATLQTSSTAQSATSTTATSVLAAVSGTSTASTTTLAVATAGKNRPDLSPAASAGVGAAVAVVVIALAGALAYAYIRRRRRAAQEVPENPFLDDKAELAADEPGSPQASPNELSPDSQRYEAADGLRPPELDHMAVRAELEG